MRRRRSQVSLCSPAVLVAFCVSVIVPRAGLRVHTHVGGDGVHVHLDRADGDSAAPVSHRPAPSPRFWHSASLEALRAGDLRAWYTQALDEETQDHHHGAGAGTPADLEDSPTSFACLAGGACLGSAARSRNATRPWYAALVDAHLRRHERPALHHATTAGHGARAPEFTTTPTQSLRHWHAQLRST